jgi:hypothetical protein
MTNTRENIKRQRRGADGKLLANTPSLKLLEAVNDAYQAIRQHDKDVPNAVIVLGASDQKNWGHFAPESWSKDKTGRQHEIMLSGESLARGAEATFATLMHEAAHAKAHATGIKDTSRLGRYHNTRFKSIAEALGLTVSQDSRNGWSYTDASKEAKREYTKEITAIRSALKTYRVGFVKETRPRGKRTQLLQTASGRTLRVPMNILMAGGIFDEVTGEKFLPVEGS